MTSVAAVSGATGTSGTAVSQVAGPSLDYEAFLKLLVTQMENQDPLDPMVDTEYVA